MRMKGLIYISVAMLVISVALSVLLLHKNHVNIEVDVVAVNELVKMVEQHWPDVAKGSYSETGLDFSIVSANGELIYQNSDTADHSINEAIKNRSTVVDIAVNQETVGKVMIHNNYGVVIAESKKQLGTALMIIAIVISLFLIAYTAYIHHIIFKPFQQLEHFAQHIARGNLDIPLRMVKDNPFGAFTESFDMMRDQLAAARQSEYEANRSKKELVASLSHDIKTPVSSIKAISELMLLRADDEKTIKQLNTIYAKSEQIHLLVTDMFHATLEELNELKVNLSEELSAILYEMIESVNYDDRILCGAIPECMLRTDITRLQQVIDNVVNNSYKYAGTEVSVQANMTNECLELHITDEGKGIKEEEIPLVFRKFYRGSNVEGQSGTGLGLYISKYLMNKMQGDIYCFNHERGFTVVLQIPLA